MCVCVHVCVCVRVVVWCVCMYACCGVCACVCCGVCALWTCVCVCVHACVHACVRACMRVCVRGVFCVSMTNTHFLFFSLAGTFVELCFTQLRSSVKERWAFCLLLMLSRLLAGQADICLNTNTEK